MSLPGISIKTISSLNKTKSSNTIVNMGRINYSDNYQDGDYADSKNISAKRYPYLTTRNGRRKLDYENVTAMCAWDKLITVKGNKVYYDGNPVEGTVTEGEKQFAIVNTKCVIWPDKKYLDLTSLKLKPLGADQSGAGGTFTKNSLTVNWGISLTDYFNAGDAITISGCVKESGNNKDIVIQAVTGTTITVSDDAFVATTETATLNILRKIPDLDYICESENRLWGCSNSDRTIYASALGDPTNFFTYEGVSTDAYAVAVGSEGDFTGCCKLSSSVLFWKETCMHKMLGSYPAEYSLYTYSIEGLRKGCHKSMQVINDVLFYVGLHGVFAYSGGTPSLMSFNFGNTEFTEAVAGNDGDTYFLSAKANGKSKFLLYETTYNIWVCEDTIEAIDFARIGKDMYFLTKDGEVFLEDTGEEDKTLDWYAVTKPFYETINGRKVNSKLQLRVELPKGSHFSVYSRCDGKTWKKVSTIFGNTNNVIPMRFAIERCDKFELKFEGKGKCTILGMNRMFMVGSDM